jgi:hypothetical protein
VVSQRCTIRHPKPNLIKGLDLAREVIDKLAESNKHEVLALIRKVTFPAPMNTFDPINFESNAAIGSLAIALDIRS